VCRVNDDGTRELVSIHAENVGDSLSGPWRVHTTTMVYGASGSSLRDKRLGIELPRHLGDSEVLGDRATRQRMLLRVLHGGTGDPSACRSLLATLVEIAAP